MYFKFSQKIQYKYKVQYCLILSIKAKYIEIGSIASNSH